MTSDEPGWRRAVARAAIPIGTGLVALVGTYLAGATGWAHALFAAGVIAMGFAARVWLGPGKGMFVALSMAVLLPLVLLAAFEPANVPLLGWDMRQRLGAMFKVARLAIVSGGSVCALLMTVLSLKRVPRPAGTKWLVALAASAVVLGGFAGLGAQRVFTRPALPDFAGTLEDHAPIRPAPLPDTDACLLGPCKQLVFEDDEVRLVRECRRRQSCDLSLDLRDGFGPRRMSLRVDLNSKFVLRTNREKGVWVVENVDRFSPGSGSAVAVAGVRPRGSTVRSSDARGAIAPETSSVAFAAVAALLSLLGCRALIRRRREMDALRAAREAQLDADGWLSVSGEEAELRRALDATDFAPGPVLVAQDRGTDDYREAAARPLRVLAPGTKAEAIDRVGVDALDVGAILLVAAAHLAVPLLAEALAGRVF